MEHTSLCVLAVALPDGSPHGAVVHFSSERDPLRFFIMTYPTVKIEAIRASGGASKAAIVIGCSEKEFVTLQMRGDVRIVSERNELEHIHKIHYAKHPESEKYKNVDTIFLELIPTWWRYTDLKTHSGAIVSSE